MSQIGETSSGKLIDMDRINDTLGDLIETKLELNLEIDKEESYWE